MKGADKLGVFAALIMVIGLTIIGVPAGAQSVSSLSLTVYEDGYVLVNETILTANYTVVLDVPLLGEHVEGFLAVDENGELLPFEITGSNATIYFENASVVYVSYYTPDLTSKDGPVWTLSLQSPVEVSITLPDDAIITDLSDIPLKIQGNTIVMPPGNISVSYIIPIQTTTTTSSSGGQGSTTSTTSTTVTTTTSGGGSGTASTSTTPTTTSSSTTPSGEGGQTNGGSSTLKWVGLIVVILVIAGGAYLYFRSRSEGGGVRAEVDPEALQRFKEKIESLPDLNDDERGALIYLAENGGKAPQAKVRDALGLPKTTAWRMFRRLEERGLVRVYKLGRENWVELVLD